MTKRRWTIPLATAVLGAGLLWLLLGGEPIEEGRCTLVWRKVNPSSELARLASQVLEPQTTRPQGLRDLPAGFDNPCFYQVRSSDRAVPLVVSLSGRPVLCLDMDGDGILSEERHFTATRAREIKGAAIPWRFGPISLASSDHPDEVDSGGFYVNCYSREAIVRPVSFRTGRLKLEGRVYRVIVADGDCDGRFHSILSLPIEGRSWQLPGVDVFAIDLNRNGKFDSQWFSPAASEVSPLGRLVRVGDAYYAVEIAPDGTSLALSRTEPQLGTLVIEPNGATAQVKLWSDAAAQCLQGGQWQLPAGKYHGIYADFQMKDAAGDVWSFSCDLNSGSPLHPLGALKFFTIEPGQTTRLRFGPPFVATAEVQQTGRVVSIISVIFGCGGERYKSTVLRNGQRRPEHTFKIVDEEGTVLIADKFQYG